VTTRHPAQAQDRAVSTPHVLVIEVPALAELLKAHGIEEVAVVDVDGTAEALEAARAAGRRVVLLSSCVVYGNARGTIDESRRLRPRTASARAVARSERLAAAYAERHGLDVVVLRLGQAYGPAVGFPAPIDGLVRGALAGDPVRLAAGAEQAFHLTHGEDVSRAVRAALDVADPRQRVFNITGGERQSLADVATLVRARFPRCRISVGPGRLPRLDRQGSLDIRAADRGLGYRPRWGLARGIDDYVDAAA
jgi:nucleoside-diphosphate-sugar epimerase